MKRFEANITPYRVIADHARAASFLIADGVVPGNLGRNYICRMIIRRAYRFGGKIGLTDSFLARISDIVVDNFGSFYPELEKNRTTILQTITREELQFQRTLEKATGHLGEILDQLESLGQTVLSGEQAANLYTTYGMPLEITRDIAEERGLFVDDQGFTKAMAAHRLASGAGKAIGEMGGEDVEIYRNLRDELTIAGRLPSEGVKYEPYGDHNKLEFETELLALVIEGQSKVSAAPGDKVEVLLPETKFYIESGGQVSDTGTIYSLPIYLHGNEPRDEIKPWQINITDMRKPAAGIIVHVGQVVRGTPNVGDKLIAVIDCQRRKDVMRNHTATHLLHSALQEILGPHARQAGSLVAPERLRFDFTHPEALTYEQIEEIESYVNGKILENYPLAIQYRSLQDALNGGAIALFGEKYGETVRNIQMGGEKVFSNELCGGTHVEETNDIGIFTITSEGSIAAGIRRIEAITGREAFRQYQGRRKLLNQVAEKMGTSPDKVVEKASALNDSINDLQKQIAALRSNMAALQFTRVLDDTVDLGEVKTLTAHVRDADANTLRQLADQFRNRNPNSGVVVLGTVQNEKPLMIAAVTEDLVKRGIKAGDLVKYVAQQVGGGGGGKPTIAQAGGRDASKLDQALASVPEWIQHKLGQK